MKNNTSPITIAIVVFFIVMIASMLITSSLNYTRSQKDIEILNKQLEVVNIQKQNAEITKKILEEKLGDQ